MVSIPLACRKSYVFSCAASKSMVTPLRSFSGFRLRMDQASLRPLTKPRVGNIVQAFVERTFAWLNRCRRLAKDFENLADNALAFLRLASIRLMLRRLCNPS